MVGRLDGALVATVLVSAALLALAIYLPPLREPFGTEALGPAELGVVAAFALIPTALIEAVKAFRPRRRPGR